MKVVSKVLEKFTSVLQWESNVKAVDDVFNMFEPHKDVVSLEKKIVRMFSVLGGYHAILTLSEN